jgi:hypothetical protein
MKLHTETVRLPAYFASALINGDYSGLSREDTRIINSWIADFPFYGACLSCSDHIEVDWVGSCFATSQLCETLDFTFPVIYERDGYLVYPVSVKTDYLGWQKMGLTYTATGYGSKIPTTQMILLCGKWRRVYCTQYSNAGSCWVIFNGKKINVERVL